VGESYILGLTDPLTVVRRKAADEIYQLGIARRAQPLEHLKSRYDEFQKRMLIALSSPDQSQMPSPPSGPATRAPFGAGAAVTLPSSAQASATARPRSNAPLQVFVDNSENTDVASITFTNVWSDFGTHKTRVKENAPQVKRLGGTTLKQAGKSKRLAVAAATPSSRSKITPFIDPEPAPTPPPRSTITPFVDSAPACASVTTSKPGGGGFMPFQDGGVSLAKGIPSTPAKFVPFCDEVSFMNSSLSVHQH
jgi:hypothetical protein